MISGNKVTRRADKLAAGVLALALSTACAAPRPGDPLVQSKKLIVAGHRSLYTNGALRVPNTSIRLIPPGPSAIDLAEELMGWRARKSLDRALQEAAESVTVVSDGAKLTVRLSTGARAQARAAAEAIARSAREGSRLVVYKSSDFGKDLAGDSWSLSGRLLAGAGEIGRGVSAAAGRAGERISAGGSEQGMALAKASREAANRAAKAGWSQAGSALSWGKQRFVLGYAVLPERAARRSKESLDLLTDGRWAQAAAEENSRRRRLSEKFANLMSDTVSSAPSETAQSLRNAANELRGNLRTTGLSLSVLKSLRWVLQGVLWEATLEPAAGLAGAGLGYIGVNLAAFPVLVTAREGYAATKLAVEVGWNAGLTAYDLIAPTAEAALAGVYATAAALGGGAGAGVVAGAGSAAGFGEAALSRLPGVAVKGAGVAAGKAVQYVGVPLAAAGIAVGGGTFGTVAQAAGAAGGGALRVTGETAAASAKALGNVIAAGMLAGGAAASTSAGAALAVYSVYQAVAVPAGYELGGGMVLGYGTLSHLGAHSILAASDCAYVVLSLEGPRWVLYAVKGKVSSGEDLPVGAVMDLKGLRAAGEEIDYLPVSDDEMRAAVHAAYEELAADPRNPLAAPPASGGDAP